MKRKGVPGCSILSLQGQGILYYQVRQKKVVTDIDFEFEMLLYFQFGNKGVDVHEILLK